MIIISIEYIRFVVYVLGYLLPGKAEQLLSSRA